MIRSDHRSRARHVLHHDAGIAGNMFAQIGRDVTRPKIVKITATPWMTLTVFPWKKLDCACDPAPVIISTKAIPESPVHFSLRGRISIVGRVSALRTGG